ncbi:MAG: hypothetical protein ACLQVL_28165 [Terriglobia bacterium]
MTNGKMRTTREAKDWNVDLSRAYAERGSGKIDKDYKILFEFTSDGKHYTVALYRAFAEELVTKRGSLG